MNLRVNLCVANPILQMYVANGGGGETDPSNISAAIQDRDKISTATPPFLLTAIPMELLVKLPDATGSGKS